MRAEAFYLTMQLVGGDPGYSGGGAYANAIPLLAVHAGISIADALLVFQRGRRGSDPNIKKAYANSRVCARKCTWTMLACRIMHGWLKTKRPSCTTITALTTSSTLRKRRSTRSGLSGGFSGPFPILRGPRTWSSHENTTDDTTASADFRSKDGVAGTRCRRAPYATTTRCAQHLLRRALAV